VLVLGTGGPVVEGIGIATDVNGGIDMTNAAPAPPDRAGRPVLRGLLDLRPSRGVERAAVAADEAVAQGLATAKVYAFASADYPGAAQSDVFDTDGTITVGAFVFDPSNANSPTTAFTFGDGGGCPGPSGLRIL
jgi:hypothetical protein